MGEDAIGEETEVAKTDGNGVCNKPGNESDGASEDGTEEDGDDDLRGPDEVGREVGTAVEEEPPNRAAVAVGKDSNFVLEEERRVFVGFNVKPLRTPFEDLDTLGVEVNSKASEVVEAERLSLERSLESFGIMGLLSVFQVAFFFADAKREGVGIEGDIGVGRKP